MSDIVAMKMSLLPLHEIKYEIWFHALTDSTALKTNNNPFYDDRELSVTHAKMLTEKAAQRNEKLGRSPRAANRYFVLEVINKRTIIE